MKAVCGIDFGTSNSTVGVYKGGEFKMVPLENGHKTIPSAIFYPAEGKPPIYGRTAVEAYTARDPGRLMRSLKSILGSNLIDEKTGVGGKYRSFEEILVGFVQYLKHKAEEFSGTPIDEVVMGRPVHFVDDNPEADKRAQDKLEKIAKKAGFKKVLFQFEPIAAALQFENELSQDELVFIADIGGGTADFSIVRVGPKRKHKTDRSKDILANEGVHVGGTNLDMRLNLESVMPLLGRGSTTREGRELPNWPFSDLATWHRIHTISDAKNMTSLRQILYEAKERHLLERYMHVVREQTGHMIAKRVEEAKIELSNQDITTIKLEMVENGLTAIARRSAFEQSIESELAKIERSVAETLEAAKLDSSEITSVFLTGGTSVVPAVKKVLTEPFKDAKVVQGDLFSSVGFGLTLDAKRRFLPESGQDR